MTQLTYRSGKVCDRPGSLRVRSALGDQRHTVSSLMAETRVTPRSARESRMERDPAPRSGVLQVCSRMPERPTMPAKTTPDRRTEVAANRTETGPSRDWGCDGGRVFRARSLTEGGYVAWVLRLVEIGAEGEGSCADVVEISRPDGRVDIADLGLTLAEAKLVLAGVQREIVAAQARDHAVRRPGCRRCEGVCRVKDYRQHAIATLFGQVAVRLPHFCCAGCGTTGTGVEWPPYACSTPELDRLRAQLSALLTYRTAAALLGQMFPVDAGQNPETLRRHTFKIA